MGGSFIHSIFSCPLFNKHFHMTPVFSHPHKCQFILFIYLPNYVDKFQSLNILLDIYKYIIHTKSSTVITA